MDEAVILYRLICADGHEFDAWFRNSATFDRQAAKGVLSCPNCNSDQVTKAMMSPRINRGATLDIEPAASGQNVALTASTTPEAMGLKDMLRALRRQVEENCDYVGDKFAQEARAIAEDRADPRNIYGEATSQEVRELLEDGIDVAPLPWLPPHDA
jgi:hypothetical protein